MTSEVITRLVGKRETIQKGLEELDTKIEARTEKEKTDQVTVINQCSQIDTLIDKLAVTFDQALLSTQRSKKTLNRVYQKHYLPEIKKLLPEWNITKEKHGIHEIQQLEERKKEIKERRRLANVAFAKEKRLLAVLSQYKQDIVTLEREERLEASQRERERRLDLLISNNRSVEKNIIPSVQIQKEQMLYQVQKQFQLLNQAGNTDDQSNNGEFGGLYRHQREESPAYSYSSSSLISSVISKSKQNIDQELKEIEQNRLELLRLRREQELETELKLDLDDQDDDEVMHQPLISSVPASPIKEFTRTKSPRKLGNESGNTNNSNSNNMITHHDQEVSEESSI